MKTLFAVTMLIVGYVHAIAGEVYVQKSCSMKIDGTSTLHDWSCPVNVVRAKGEIDINNGTLNSIGSMWVQADVLSIKSEKGNDMDTKIYEALKSEQHKFITFNLTSVKAVLPDGNGWKVEVLGDLTIAGSKKNVPLSVSATVLPTGEVRFSGTKTVKMTDFGMDRPSAMLGMIKAGDAVTITFDLLLKKG